MERKKCLWSILILVFFTAGYTMLSAQEPDVWKRQFYHAYVTGDMGLWKELLTAMEKQHPEAVKEKLDLIHYYYGYIGYLIGTNQRKEAGIYIARADDLLKKLLDEYPKNASLYAYRSAFAGFKMGLNKLRVVTLGPQSLRNIQQAWKLDSTDVQVITDRAHFLFYAPGLVGGDKKEALRLYHKSIETLEETGDSKENWFYLSVLTSLARAYEEMGQKEDAIVTYNKILSVEPEYIWVKDELHRENNSTY